MKSRLSAVLAPVFAVVAAVALAVAPLGAAAQETADDDVSPNTSAAERFAGNFVADGVKTGGFTLFPAAQIDATYNDNIFSTPDEEVNDLVVDFQGGMRAQSNWSTHQLILDARTRRRQYVDNTAESTTDYSFGAAGRLDLGARSLVRLTGGYQRATEPRSTIQTAIGALTPVRFSSFTAGADGAFRQSRTRQEIGVAFRYDNFTDADAVDPDTGVPFELDQDFRDTRAYTAYVRQFFRVAPTVEVFAGASGAILDFLEPQLEFGAAQDSIGYTASGGVAFDINKVARGQVGLGYTSRDFDDPVFIDVEGLNVDAEIEYFATDLTTITLTADRAIRDAAVIGAAGFWTNGVGARIEHELLRNVLLTASGEYRRDDFRGLERTDELIATTVGVDYAFRREVQLSLRYRRIDISSEGDLARDGFVNNLLTFGIRVRL